jgi:hypothetical protein
MEEESIEPLTCEVHEMPHGSLAVEVLGTGLELNIQPIGPTFIAWWAKVAGAPVRRVPMASC